MHTEATLETRHFDLRSAAARLAALAATVALDIQPAAWQDGLDLLAVANGLKPVCLLGRGDGDAGWLDGARALAATLGLTALTGGAWQPILPDAAFPAWYRAATAERDARQSAIYLWRNQTVGARVRLLCAEHRVAAADEAALLGYPPCCVAQHHAQAEQFEALTIAWAERMAGGDPARRHRLIAAGTMPTAITAADRERLASATAIAPQPYTSVNRCAVCVADPDGPAARLGRRYRDLARDLGYAAPATVH
jgi:hypothetical protein